MAPIMVSPVLFEIFFAHFCVCVSILRTVTLIINHMHLHAFNEKKREFSVGNARRKLPCTWYNFGEFQKHNLIAIMNIQRKKKQALKNYYLSWIWPTLHKTSRISRLGNFSKCVHDKQLILSFKGESAWRIQQATPRNTQMTMEMHA